MLRLLIILSFIATNVYSQSSKNFLSDFLLEDELSAVNSLSTNIKFDFSSLWTQTENHFIVGTIGSDLQRIKIKLTKVNKSENNPNIYLVTGKSSVKGNICSFTGTITLTEIREVKRLHYGVDDVYADSGLKAQGILIASYKFREDSIRPSSGIFEGQLYTKWYLDSENKIHYDNIQSIADNYMNNAFIGSWMSQNTKITKPCNWADYRVPLVSSEFDVGAGEFSPSEKYCDKGWGVYQKAWLYGDETARKEELSEWWK